MARPPGHPKTPNRRQAVPQQVTDRPLGRGRRETRPLRRRPLTSVGGRRGAGRGRGLPSFQLSVLCAKLLQSRPTLCDPMDCSPQAPPSMGFSRQEHWSGLLTSHQSIESSVTVCSGEEPPWAKWPWPLRVVTQHHFHQHVSSCGR